MQELSIKEIKSDQSVEYKKFLNVGLVNDEDSFRISQTDELQLIFPTKDCEDSFTLGAYINSSLTGVVSFTRDGADREKLRHKGILFRMYVSAEHRGFGISKKLIESLLSRVYKIEDIEQVNLTVVSNNLTAKKLYEKFGFVTFGSELNAIKWNGKYFNEDQMVFRLK